MMRYSTKVAAKRVEKAFTRVESIGIDDARTPAAVDWIEGRAGRSNATTLDTERAADILLPPDTSRGSDPRVRIAASRDPDFACFLAFFMMSDNRLRALLSDSWGWKFYVFPRTGYQVREPGEFGL
jgi:hypothetical protein